MARSRAWHLGPRSVNSRPSRLPTFGKLLHRGPVGIARRVPVSAGFGAALMQHLPTRGRRLRVDWRSTTSHMYFAREDVIEYGSTTR
jgi:hypothetical protein